VIFNGGVETPARYDNFVFPFARNDTVADQGCIVGVRADRGCDVSFRRPRMAGESVRNSSSIMLGMSLFSERTWKQRAGHNARPRSVVLAYRLPHQPRLWGIRSRPRGGVNAVARTAGGGGERGTVWASPAFAKNGATPSMVPTPGRSCYHRHDGRARRQREVRESMMILPAEDTKSAKAA
jgi:hypothetical protein